MGNLKFFISLIAVVFLASGFGVWDVAEQEDSDFSKSCGLSKSRSEIVLEKYQRKTL